MIAPTTRREFLRTTTALGLAGVFHPVSTHTMELGYLLGCYTRPWDQYDYRIALDGIAEEVT